ESGCRPPAMEPGHGAADRRHRFEPVRRSHPHPRLQRLRRAGGLAVCRDGPATLLLMTPDHHAATGTGRRNAARPRTPTAVVVVKLALFVACLLPAALLAWAIARNQLGPDPVAQLTHETGTWALRLLLATLAMTPLRRLTGASLPI